MPVFRRRGKSAVLTIKDAVSGLCLRAIQFRHRCQIARSLSVNADTRVEAMQIVKSVPFGGMLDLSSRISRAIRSVTAWQLAGATRRQAST